MITDGECAVSPEFTSAFTEAKKELGFRMFGILIGFHSKVLASLSEETYTTRDLTKGDELNDMFTHL